MELAKKLLSKSSANKILLPVDHLIADNPDAQAETSEGINIPEGKMALDIGPETIQKYSEALSSAKTVLWNGPMGFFERKFFKGDLLCR